MKNIKTKTILLFACMAALATCAQASLYNDPAAMTGFAGTTSIEVTQSGITLKTGVEYAVYAPGTYPGGDISDGGDYIYAFQIFNHLKGNVAVDFFSIGISSPSIVTNVYIDSTYGYNPSVAIDPAIKEIFAQSVGFIFLDPILNPRDWSSVLIFTSANGPAMGFGTVSGGGFSGMCSLPTPVPEPVTIAIIVPALLALRSKNKRKARVKL